MSAWLAALGLKLLVGFKGLPWRKILPWALLAAGIAALLFAVDSRGYRRGVAHEHPIAFKAGQIHQDAIWTRNQALAAERNKASNRRTEAAQAAVTTKVGDKHATAHAALRADYDRLRDKARNRDASQGGTSGLSGPACGTFAPPGADDIVVAAPLGLIEEGDEYRLQVLGWQEWYAGVAAAAKQEE